MTRFCDDAARFFPAASLTQVPQLLIVEPIPFVLTAEQHAALQSLQAAVTDESTAIVIQAPRGRGKSTLLGLWMAATHTPTQFILCAPSLANKRAVSSVICPVTLRKRLNSYRLTSYSITLHLCLHG